MDRHNNYCHTCEKIRSSASSLSSRANLITLSAVISLLFLLRSECAVFKADSNKRDTHSAIH